AGAAVRRSARERPGRGRRGPPAARLHPHHRADRWTRGPARRGRGQPGACRRRGRHRHHHPDPADQRRLRPARNGGGRRGGGGRARRRGGAGGAGLGPGRAPAAGHRHPVQPRQPDRHPHRHAAPARAVRQRRRCAVSQPVGERAPAPGQRGRDRDPRCGGAVRQPGQLRLRDRRGRHRQRAPGAAWRGAWRPGGGRGRPGGRRARGAGRTGPAVRRQQGRRGRASGRRRRRGRCRRPRRGGAGRAAMNVSRPFILRPVATSLLMVALLLSGLFAYRLLPVSALPQVDYPIIQVMTLYPGASPTVTTSAVTAPLERRLGQIPGLNQMSSTSSGGASVITLQFSLEVDLGVAEQEVQAAINAASSFLPGDLPMPPVYRKVNPADTPILTLAVTSPTVALPDLYDLVDTRMAQRLSQLPGVGLVSLAGGQRPAVRIQGNPNALAATGLGMGDIRRAISAAIVNMPKRSFDGPTRAIMLDANDQMRAAQECRDQILAWNDGGPLRRGDVATVEQGPENSHLAAWSGPMPAILINIQRQPGANVIEVVDRVQALLPQLRAAMPAAVQVEVLSDRTESIRASIRGVQHELLLAIALVVGVTFVFLRTIPATIIPSIAVPLSLVATFGVMLLAGFSLNNLTLMALTIATGFVVDDAIVMLENIARHMEDGAGPLEAALNGARQI